MKLSYDTDLGNDTIIHLSTFENEQHQNPSVDETPKQKPFQITPSHTMNNQDVSFY